MTTKPLLFLTGFLGAGKTTLLRDLLQQLNARGLKADVILNDVANADLDVATLEGKAASIEPIAASCACCESLDELVALCRTAARGKGDFLLIELNGTADPLSLMEAFALLENKMPFFPRLQVCLVDARHWGQRGEFSALERRQLETAGFWTLSHAGNAESKRIEDVHEKVSAFAPFSKRVEPDELVDLLADELSPIRRDRCSVAGPGSHARTESENAFANQAMPTDETHQLSHRFTGCTIPLPPRVRRRSLERLLRDLPPWVMRAKAMVKLVEEPGSRWLFQRSGTDELPEPISVPEVRRVTASLVCVGPQLDRDLLQRLVRDRFGEATSTGIQQNLHE